MPRQGSRNGPRTPIRSDKVSFRNRLALFFVLIVIVPMLAVTFLLFRLIDESATGQADAAINQRHTFASTLFREQKQLARQAVEDVGEDRVFTGALQDGDLDRARRRAEQLLDSRAIERIVFVRNGEPIVRAGDKRAIAPAVAQVESNEGRRLGTLGVSIIDAPTYVERMRSLAGLEVVVVNGERVLAAPRRLSGIDASDLPGGRGDKQELGGTEYRVQNFPDRSPFQGQEIRIFTLGNPDAIRSQTTDDKLFAGAILLGFFLLAIACAVLVSRTLQQQIAEFLTAARRLASGDFSAKVPTVGHDEFADLGEEFNKMSSELERRLAELSQERVRVQDSMRRLGEAVGANLDRDALLELVVRTAVDGVGADGGRASVRRSAEEPLEEVAAAGRVNGVSAAIRAAEHEVLLGGHPVELTLDNVTALAHPLHEEESAGPVSGVVAVARNGRRFDTNEQELFHYLAGQAAVSIANVGLHETVERQAVTDELTGLSNRRRFEEKLEDEVERFRRFGQPVGLVLLDIDDFKRVNDTHGHQQGDVVLREVARVLRETSREVDEPARYGGEELAVVLPGTDLEGAVNLAERVRRGIEELAVHAATNGALKVTASLGVATLPGAGYDARSLVEAADDALYRAKRMGKNRTERNA